jgi:hypothetical protein
MGRLSHGRQGRSIGINADIYWWLCGTEIVYFSRIFIYAAVPSVFFAPGVEYSPPGRHPEMIMATNYVLIDYENVHPRNLELLTQHPFKVYVFVGENQAKISFDLADSMQLLGNHARYIKIASRH